MALNNLGMGLVYTVQDQASRGLATISTGINNVTQAAQRSAGTVPPILHQLGWSTGQTFASGSTAVQGFSSTFKIMGSQFTGIAGKAQSAFQRIVQAVRSPVDHLMNLKNLLTGIAAAWGGMKVVGAASFEEQSKMSLEVMLRDRQAAEMVFEKARHFADITPFDTQGVIQAATGAVSSRFSLNEIFKGGLLRDMGDLAAANPGASIQEIGNVFGRLKAGGFGEAFERLRALKISITDLQQAGLKIRAGGNFTNLNPDTVVAAVRKIIQQRFGGMMDKMQNSWQGVWSTFTSNITNAAAAVGDAKMPGAQNLTVLDAIKQRVKSLTDLMVDSEGKTTVTMQRIIAVAARAFGLTGRVWDAMVSGAGKVIHLFGALQDGFGWLPDTTEAFQKLSTFLSATLAPLTNEENWRRAGELLRVAFNAALPVVGDLWRIFTSLTGVLGSMRGLVTAFIKPWVGAGGLSIWHILQTTVGVLADFAEWLNSGATGAKLLVDGLAAVAIIMAGKWAVSTAWEMATALYSAAAAAGKLAISLPTTLIENLQMLYQRALYAKDALVEMAETAYLKLLYAKDAVFGWGKAVWTWATEVAWANIQQAALTAWGYAVAAAQWVATAATTAWTAAIEFLNLAFVETPIGWIVLGIGALIAVVYLAVKYWDQWTGALVRFGRWVWGELKAGFGMITTWFSNLPGTIQWALAAFMPFIGLPLLVIEHWSVLKEWFAGLFASLSEMWGWFTDWWDGKISTFDLLRLVGDKMLAAGRNLINMLGQGIKSAWNGLTGVVKQAAGVIMDFLGFHSPTRLGPGHDADKWAPNLMRMYAGGLEDGIPDLQAASNRAANALSASLTPTVTPGGVVAPAGAEKPATASTASRSGQPSGGPASITVVAKLVLPDGRELAEAIIPVLRQEALLGYGR